MLRQLELEGQRAGKPEVLCLTARTGVCRMCGAMRSWVAAIASRVTAPPLVLVMIVATLASLLRREARGLDGRFP